MNPIEEIACFVASERARELDETVRYEAQRLLVDCLGCTLAGCDADALEGERAAARPGAEQQATVPGSGERFDLPTVAAMVTRAAAGSGFAAEHPDSELVLPAVVAGALLPLAQWQAASGAALVDAYACAIELGVRLADAEAASGARAMTAAAAAAASAGCAHLLQLDAAGTTRVLGEAVRRSRAAVGACDPRLGSATAARNAIEATLGLQHADDFEASSGDREAWAAGLSGPALVAGLGSRWQLSRIAYKTYPCARFLHPVVEACQALQRCHRPPAAEIDAVELRVNPAVLVRSAGPEPVDLAAARRSLQHAAAAALLHGTAARQFEAAALASERLVRLRARVQAHGDEALGPDAAHVFLHMRNGAVRAQEVRRAHGSPERPLTDAELAAKFRRLAARALATDQAERLLALAWNLPALADAGALARGCVPEEEAGEAVLPGSPLIPR